MKEVDVKQTPDVAGGEVSGCVPLPVEDPLNPSDPITPPFDPWTDPIANRT